VLKTISLYFSERIVLRDTIDRKKGKKGKKYEYEFLGFSYSILFAISCN